MYASDTVDCYYSRFSQLGECVFIVGDAKVEPIIGKTEDTFWNLLRKLFKKKVKGHQVWLITFLVLRDIEEGVEVLGAHNLQNDGFVW